MFINHRLSVCPDICTNRYAVPLLQFGKESGISKLFDVENAGQNSVLRITRTLDDARSELG
ncbi:hypothetical protein BDZ91DRAFT_731037 [Kalaharituber pfeilii]|nr:hypothetical protein BDZ91DRAFT_731037 [Kalaharituber pfeilii]